MSEGGTAAAPEGAHHTDGAYRESTLTAFARLVRPAQWSKNGLLFLPFLFSLNLHWNLEDPGAAAGLLLRAALAALIYCGLSGATYIINDIIDAERDRVHPTKRERPIAAGRVNPRDAGVVAVILLVVCLGASTLLSVWLGLVAAAYVGVTVGYSVRLKNVMIVDVMAVAAAYVIRVLAGAVAIDVPISEWLYVCTTLAALFISIGKRRAEAELMEDGAPNHRGTLDQYSVPLLNQMMAVVTPSTLIAYALYTFTAPNLPPQMMLTIPFVIYGIFRYLYLAQGGRTAGAPERVLLEDRPMILTVGAWLAAIVIILLIFPRPA